MASTDANWSAYLERTLQRYDEPLLRQMTGKLFKPRNQWPVDELIERSIATVNNAAVVDRRLKDLDQASRRLLALIGHSRQPRWKLGQLLELLAALGHAEGPRPIFTLFEAGLLYPDLLYAGRRAEAKPADEVDGPQVAPLRLRNFEQWLGQASATEFRVFAHPLVTVRALGEDLGLPALATSDPGPAAAVREADGLEWPLRLAVLWQQVAASPLRLTQQGDFFKRDLERLRTDPLLSGPPPDNLAELPDVGLLAVALAMLAGIVTETEGELRPARLPADWEEGLFPVLAALWKVLPELESWDVQTGWHGGAPAANPYASAYLLALLLLAQLPADAWAAPADLDAWIREHHPYWGPGSKTGAKTPQTASSFLMGLAYQLRLIQAAQTGPGAWVIRLAPLGRWLLGRGEAPPAPVTFPQTLLVQPNLEIVAYRQGLTPGLIAQLARFATWKSLGAACTLQLEPESVYRALEAGETFETICRALERHGMRAVPTAVVDSLRTWSDKRERIAIFPSATLFEFASAEDLNEAIARGLPGVRLTDRLAAVASESAVDFRHFRLTSTRDYSLPPEKCVEVGSDGVTLSIDLTRSDLLVETELQRFAEPLEQSGPRNIDKGTAARHYRLTPGSLAASREGGLTQRTLDEWFMQRSGRPLSAAARLLLAGPQVPALELRRHLVLTVATAEVADGLLQWPDTRALIENRLGPTTLTVAEENAGRLRERLQVLGIAVTGQN